MYHVNNRFRYTILNYAMECSIFRFKHVGYADISQVLGPFM